MMYFVDLDGVLVDFVGSALRLFQGEAEAEATLFDWPRGEWDIAKVIGVSQASFWAAIDKAGEEWWATLPEYPWAQTLLRVVGDQGEYMIATSPSLHHSSHAGKVRWMKRRFHEQFRSYVLTEHKHLLAGPSRTLIDDSERNCERFEAAGGTAILFPRPWNRLGEIADPVGFVVESLGAKA